MELEEGRDADGIVLGPEEGMHGFLGGVVPSGESNTIWIGVGEEDDFVVLKGDELGDLEFAKASGSQPDVLGIKLRENNSRFLCFNNTDGRCLMADGRCKKMLAEETVSGLEGVLRDAKVLFQ